MEGARYLSGAVLLWLFPLPLRLRVKASVNSRRLFHVKLPELGSVGARMVPLRDPT